MKTWFRTLIVLCLVVQLLLSINSALYHGVIFVCAIITFLSILGLPFGCLLVWTIIDLDDFCISDLEDSRVNRKGRTKTFIKVVFLSIPTFATLMFVVYVVINLVIWLFHLRIVCVS